MCGIIKREVFNALLDKIRSRTSNWCNKSLSAAGKEILIKAILQALSIYLIPCFLIPETNIRKLQSAMVRYWWGSGEGNKKVHWISKKILHKNKLDGGLGLKDLHSFKLALLEKQGWRILENLNSLMARVLKAKYFPRVTS